MDRDKSSEKEARLILSAYYRERDINKIIFNPLSNLKKIYLQKNQNKIFNISEFYNSHLKNKNLYLQN